MEGTLVAGITEVCITIAEIRFAGTKSYDKLISCKFSIFSYPSKTHFSSEYIDECEEFAASEAGRNEFGSLISFFEMLSNSTSRENFIVSATTISGMLYVLHAEATTAVPISAIADPLISIAVAEINAFVALSMT